MAAVIDIHSVGADHTARTSRPYEMAHGDVIPTPVLNMGSQGWREVVLSGLPFIMLGEQSDEGSKSLHGRNVDTLAGALVGEGLNAQAIDEEWASNEPLNFTPSHIDGLVTGRYLQAHTTRIEETRLAARVVISKYQGEAPYQVASSKNKLNVLAGEGPYDVDRTLEEADFSRHGLAMGIELYPVRTAYNIPAQMGTFFFWNGINVNEHSGLPGEPPIDFHEFCTTMSSGQLWLGAKASRDTILSRIEL